MRDDRDQDDGAGWNNLAADDLAEAERAVDDLAANDRAEGDFERAQFPIRLNLPTADEVPLEEAREAVRREYRDAVIWKRMRCRKVERLSESETGTVFVLDVGHAVEFDWTWEGATAFRPLLLNEFVTEQASFEDDSNERSNVADSVLWSGEVLEVDEAAGRIYVCVADPELPPTTGTFFVRPFEFLACLQSLFNEPAFERLRELLPERLLAAEGWVHPAVDRFSAVGLTQLREWWGKAWSVLWGPPGTGKTHTTGQQVAQLLSDPSERILVVSTTNRATDAVALAVGRAAKSTANAELLSGSLLRIGKGASLQKYVAADLVEMLQGTEAAFLGQIDELSLQVARTADSAEKALLRKQIKELRSSMQDAAQRNFLDREVRVVVSTAYKATTFLRRQELKEDLEVGLAPFTTIFIDEAGLISRAAVAALSLLASRRVVLVGDSKQLAPISRISRILPTQQMKWLANSGLSHLEAIRTAEVGVHVLQEQRRMHHQVCRVVSQYQYDGLLVTAPEVQQRDNRLPDLWRQQPRAIWYVLDDDGEELPNIRAERGPGNRSWIRVATRKILARLLADPTFRSAHGLFISPFKAQAMEIGAFFAEQECHSWAAATVHSQQGSEADIVLFDTVNAGSYSWPYSDWKRLVNVALSRAREAVMVIASRAEMDEPYLRPLLQSLASRVVRKRGSQLVWEAVPPQATYVPPTGEAVHESHSIGYQISKRQELRPVLSQEQQRLCGLTLDGKPRLVRGVAGSGKTVVLAHWLMQTVQQLADTPNLRVWAVFANRSLQSLIGDSIESAWQQEMQGQSFPWDRVSLRHIREILDGLLPEVGLKLETFQFDYDAAAKAYLARVKVEDMQPRCDALFIDEAQDMGPHALKLLAGIVRQTDLADGNRRSVNIFYDNAQNIYGRGTPTWSELGLDMRGRSSVMKESFRSTKPITDFAINVLYQLQPTESNPDRKELIARGLIERTERNGREWWDVRFNQIAGPQPTFRQFSGVEQEYQAIGLYLRELIETEGVQPADICLIYNGPNVPQQLQQYVEPVLESLGVEISVQASKPFTRSRQTLLATTSHSFKGYDAEVVIIPAVEQYRAKERGILANNLYVAMTRARSILSLFGQRLPHPDAQTICRVIEATLDNLHERPSVEGEISSLDDLADLLQLIGEGQRKWLTGLWSRYRVSQEPLVAKTGEIIAEPLFWFEAAGKCYACFGNEAPRQRVAQRLVDFGVWLLGVGQNPEEETRT